jgi:hypothetical protein
MLRFFDASCDLEVFNLKVLSATKYPLWAFTKAFALSLVQ